ncbi:DUF2975 domain-containing protein [Rufibacter sp. LB8]|uniref:DUF2975 domain-containing protein n=1 Tax=Rufibacter sp. LB8 TaxID=2777781 RepID=UPI00178C2BA7|nr:DUF2975 domain-containing protein [Rufibacter sp. LB8]
METNSKTILTLVHVLFWIIFIGLCIKTGALIFSSFVSLFVNPAGAKDLYEQLDLSELLAFNKSYYISMMSLVIVMGAVKAYLAYLVIKIFKVFSYEKPFNYHVAQLIMTISHVALGAGILGIISNSYGRWLMKKGLSLPLEWESSEFLFLAAIIFVIAQVFKKGTELQTESELTV